MDDRAATLSRLRWRLRGAWLWPAFFALTVLDALVLRWLPIAGDDGTAFIPGLLLAGLCNLLAVAVIAPLVGRRLRRRRPDLPKVVADDYAGTAVLVTLTALFVVLGVLHRPQIADDRADFTAQSQAARRYVEVSAPAEHRRRLREADSIQLDEELFRTCVPGDDPDRWLCLYIDTSGHPATVTRDTSAEPNVVFSGAGSYVR